MQEDALNCLHVTYICFQGLRWLYNKYLCFAKMLVSKHV